MANTKETLYPAHLNLMVSDDMDRDLRDAAHEMRVPMAEYVRQCIAKDLARRERNRARRAN